LNKYAARQKARPVEFTSLLKYKDMDNQPSFAERTARLKETAHQLRSAADIVLAEVQHMEAAQARFAQKGQARKSGSARA
jgi:hypothetical protein